jgi:hypothetical protein
MSLVEGLSGLFQDTQTRVRTGRRELARRAEDAVLSAKEADRTVLQSQTLMDALQEVVSTLPGRVKVGLSKLSVDKPMNLVVSFGTSTHIRSFERQWSTMIVGVQHSPEGRIPTVNGEALLPDQDLTEAFVEGTRVSYPRVYELGGTKQGRRDLFDERLMLGRARVRFPRREARK